MSSLADAAGGFLSQRRTAFAIVRNFFVRQMLDADKTVLRLSMRTDELVELGLKRRPIAVLRVLDDEHHQECDDGGPRIDD